MACGIVSVAAHEQRRGDVSAAMRRHGTTPAWWSASGNWLLAAVFPLGMYSVATSRPAVTLNLHPLKLLAGIAFWVANSEIAVRPTGYGHVARVAST